MRADSSSTPWNGEKWLKTGRYSHLTMSHCKIQSRVQVYFFSFKNPLASSTSVKLTLIFSMEPFISMIIHLARQIKPHPINKYVEPLLLQARWQSPSLFPSNYPASKWQQLSHLENLLSNQHLLRNIQIDSPPSYRQAGSKVPAKRKLKQPNPDAVPVLMADNEKTTVDG